MQLIHARIARRIRVRIALSGHVDGVGITHLEDVVALAPSPIPNALARPSPDAREHYAQFLLQRLRRID
jgi:hypothetical protein